MIILCCKLFFFFFKQKTAYEMRISDWSSDVCSSDLTCQHSPAASNIGVLSTCRFAMPHRLHHSDRAASQGISFLQLQGCITALATPFTAAGTLDLDAFARLLDQQRRAGVSGVVVAGSTGEAAALEQIGRAHV